jgi:hypothetical protein
VWCDFLLSETAERRYSKEDILNRLGTQFLLVAGYTPEQVANFGDLSKISDERMNELLHAKTLEVLAFMAAEKPPPFTKLRKEKRRRKQGK